ncbi:monocarboxylate transporter 12-like [Glandiceps talaboti]
MATSTSSKSTENTSNIDPPDGGYGWVVAFGGFLAFFLVGGQAYSFGVLYVEFLNAFGASKADTALIGALFVGSGIFGYPLSLVLIKRYGYRKVTMLAGVLSSVGIFATSFATSIVHVYIIYGIFTSIWYWQPELTTLGIISKYFNKKLPIAISLAISGTGAGQFALSFVIQLLLDKYGWRGTLMILAALNLHLCVAGALYRPIELYHWTNKKVNIEMQSYRKQCIASHQDERHDRTDVANEQIESNCNGHCSSAECQELSSKGQCTKCSHILENDKTAEESPTDHHRGSYKETCVKLWTGFLTTFDMSLFKNVAFVLMLVCGFGKQGGSYAVIAHIVKRGRDYGIPSLRSSSLPAIMGMTQFLGRIFWGVLGRVAHKMKPTILYGGSFAAAGVVTVISIHTTTYTGQLVYMVLFGICMACYKAIFPIVMRQIVGMKYFDSANMFYFTVMAIASLFCAPFVGWIRDIEGNYDLAFYLIAGIFLTSATCAFLAQIADNYNKKKERRKLKAAEYTRTAVPE